MSRISAYATAVIILAGVIGWQSLRATAPAPLPVLYTLGGDVALTSTLGRETRLADFHGELVLLSFGYTSCPDVCPTTLARMRDVLAAVPSGHVRPVFITLDPGRDTLERLRPYLAAFDPRIVGMTGSAGEVTDAAMRFHVYSRENALTSAQTLTLDHSSQIYLLDGDGRVRATFDANVPVPQMIATVQQLLMEAPG